jgi:chemotaxis protein methyltransferase CheR
VPAPVLQRYFQKGRGASDGLVRVRPEVASLVTFRRINFLDETWPVRSRLDAIFCRNVLIYFDRPTQQRVLARFVSHLTDDGLLFLGHSESVHGLVEGVTHVGNTIYRRAPAHVAASVDR